MRYRRASRSPGGRSSAPLWWCAAGTVSTTTPRVYTAIAKQWPSSLRFSKSLTVTNSPTDPADPGKRFQCLARALPPIPLRSIPTFESAIRRTTMRRVQQNVTASLLLTAQYSGVKGTRAAQEFEPNTYPIGATNPCPTCSAGLYLSRFQRQLHPQCRQSNRAPPVPRRSLDHFTYTYSKSIDDAGHSGEFLGGSVAQNWLNLAAERGLSNFDQRHLFTAALQYSTGSGVRGGALLNGWRGS